MRKTFAGFRIEAVKTRYGISAKANQAVGEVVLISNFKGWSQAGDTGFP